MVACSEAVVGGWVGLDSFSSPPCAPIHRMCSMNSYPSPPAAASCWNVPHPFLNGLDSYWLEVVANEVEKPTSGQGGLEQPMMESEESRKAGGCLVGGLVEWGWVQVVLLAGKWG